MLKWQFLNFANDLVNKSGQLITLFVSFPTIGLITAISVAAIERSIMHQYNKD